MRGSNPEEEPSEGLSIWIWARRAHDPRLTRNMMRRTDYAHFMVHASSDPALLREAPAITGVTPAQDAVAHATA